HRRQPRPQILRHLRRPFPPQPGVLYHVLGVGERPRQAIADGEQMRTQLLELVDALCGGHGSQRSQPGGREFRCVCTDAQRDRSLPPMGEGGTAPPGVEGKGLRGGSLGLVSSIVVGMASTAPAYSLAAALGLIVATNHVSVGVKAPAIVLVAFVPMYLIAVAYQELNKTEPDCG